MTSKHGLVLLALCCLIGWTGARGERGAASKLPLEPADRLIRVSVSVWDADGKPVTNLSEQDFTVLEEGVPQRLIRFLSPSAPLQLVLMLDTSQSMSYAFSRLKESMTYFVSLMGGYQEMAVVSFAATPSLETDFSGNPERLKKAITGLQLLVDRSEVTRLYDALEPTLDHLSKVGRNSRTAILLYTDGDDRGSQRQTAKSSLQLVGQRFIPFYIIEARGRDDSYLRNLAEVTGGQFFKADKFLENHLENLARQLPAQYVVGYAPSVERKGKKLVNLEVKVSKPGLKVVAPAAYRTSPDP